jgi:hypothetical protein
VRAVQALLPESLNVFADLCVFARNNLDPFSVSVSRKVAKIRKDANSPAQSDDSIAWMYSFIGSG